ncbi:unnamed protein product [Orchesella dallaii]|uniref:Uncharacterized protein n=1 Tax=Orchesella dallaii TaxID=48710 RepID=A0ABP1R361_9HEXA
MMTTVFPKAKPNGSQSDFELNRKYKAMLTALTLALFHEARAWRKMRIKVYCNVPPHASIKVFVVLNNVLCGNDIHTYHTGSPMMCILLIIVHRDTQYQSITN